jgi:uncharacterized membrane protein YGL010W
MKKTLVALGAYVAFLLALAPFNQTWYAPLAWGLGAAAVMALYWLPSLVAVGRHLRNSGSVIVLNALLGLTVIGWVIALAMACSSTTNVVRA